MQAHKQLEQVRKRVSKTLKDIQDYQKRWEDINSRGAEVANNLVNSHLRVQYRSFLSISPPTTIQSFPNPSSLIPLL
jgi:hypothetical protein